MFVLPESLSVCVDNRTGVPVRSGVIHHDNGATLSKNHFLLSDKEKSLSVPSELAVRRRCILFCSFPTRSECFAGWESLNFQGPAAESQRDNGNQPRLCR